VPEWINCPNGLIRWRDKTLHRHTPAVLSVTQLPVEYDPAAECHEFERFLAQVLPADCLAPMDGGPGFAWELLAYAVYSGNPLHVAILLFGTGRNGKGVLLHTLERLLGSNNVSSVGLHDLVGNRFRAASLYGKLANLAGDLDPRWLDSTATFKAITGGDTIMGEHKYGRPFDFRPWALPVFSTNKAFGSADSSEGYVARWIVVPFPNSFIGREDRSLEDRVGTPDELRGILRRAIEAMPTLMDRGRLPEPTSILEAKDRFITSGDRVRSWIRERCAPDPIAWTARTELFESFCKYAAATAGKPMNAAELYSRLEQIHGITPATRHGCRGFKGIRMAGGGIDDHVVQVVV
jgi:putative DNA primase/helicase